MKKNKKRRAMWILLSVIATIAVVATVFLNLPRFGRTPRGERLERIEASPNYRDGKFHNQVPTPQMTGEGSMWSNMYDFLFGKHEGRKPEAPIPTVKTDLKRIGRDEEVVVWMGHSSLFIQTDGVRFLVDPVLFAASPVSFVNRAFPGTQIYTPDDIPDIDYLLITHDHWDHLDYSTVKSLRERIGKVVCGLGVGEHFERWGFGPDEVVELDWNDESELAGGIVLHALPSRHFSGRGLSPNRTLWVSYMLETPSRNIFLSGDTGYGPHFAEIGRRFSTIDLAIMENGQYDKGWRYIHMMPDDLVKAVKDVNPARLMTVHNSKYTLSKHPWKAPLENISAAANRESFNLATPMIGETVCLRDSVNVSRKWWEEAK